MVMVGMIFVIMTMMEVVVLVTMVMMAVCDDGGYCRGVGL